MSESANNATRWAQRLVPPPGTYTYRTVSERTRQVGGSDSHSSISTDVVENSPDATEGDIIRITTTFDDSSTQQVTIQLDNAGAHLKQLRFAAQSATASTQSLSPEPPILLARLPYTEGDSWESAWQDSASGVQGVGTGQVLQREAGPSAHDVWVIELNQRFRGSASGTLRLTFWVDSTTGIRQRDESVFTTDTPYSSNTKTTRVLVT